MPYEITNSYAMLVLTLQSKQDDLKLNTYINDESTIFKAYTPHSETTDDGYELNFYILTNEYTVGDIITKFELTTNSTKHLWQTNEGIKWLIDGVESDSLYASNKTHTFDEKGIHTVEAVYVGNDALQMTTTGKYSVSVEEPPLDEEGGLDNDGAYTIVFTKTPPSTLTYGDGTKIEYELRKGGVPVVTTPPRNIEVITPRGIVSKELNNKGRCFVTNTIWNAGKYEIGAFYQDERAGRQTDIARAKKTKITIEKGTPTFSDNSASAGNFVPNSKYRLSLKFNNEPLAKTKISLYINGTLKTLTTDSKGNVYHKFTKPETVKIKAVYKGNKNLKKIEQTKTITVVKANG